jgi:hypothetical protein
MAVQQCSREGCMIAVNDAVRAGLAVLACRCLIGAARGLMRAARTTD